MATIVIARAGAGDAVWGVGIPDQVWVDNKDMGQIGYHSAFKFTCPPGHHKLTVKQTICQDPIPFNMNIELRQRPEKSTTSE
jgi:hypothetical protein